MKDIKDIENIIDKWLSRRTTLRRKREHVIAFFTKALENTALPEQSYFGSPPKKSSLNIIFGSVALAGIFGRRQLEIIVDKDISKEVGFNTRIVRSSIASGLNLYWITTDFDNIEEVTSNEKIFEHYRIASLKVNLSKRLQTKKSEWLDGKFPVSDFYTNLISQTFVDGLLQTDIESAKNDSKQKRLKRLKNANQKPTETTIQTKIYVRNPDVIVEVLERANGYCEYCKNPAPFIKDKDGSGFLEVHHILPLAENGDDTVENAVALCPNCHRHAHYGRKSFDNNRFIVQKLKKAKNTK